MGKIIIYVQSLQSATELTTGLVLATVGVALAVALALYLLRSIGVYTLAKRNGVKHGWMAWFPGLWIYPVCMLVAEYRFFGKTFRSLAVWFTVAITIGEVLTFAYNFMVDFPLIGYYLSGGVVYYGEGVSSLANVIPYWTGEVYVTTAIQYPYKNIAAVITTLDIISWITYIISFAEMIITLNVFIALFRKFWPKHYIVAAIVSFFGLFPIFAFVIRKNRPIDYASYMRSRYQGYYNVYTPRDEAPPKGEHSPFEEYPKENKKHKYEDPFEEFSDKK